MNDTSLTPDSEDADFVLPGEPPAGDDAPFAETPPEGDVQPVEEETYDDIDEDEETKFSEEDRATFASLMTVGQRIRTFSVLGHEVKMMTPTVDDELRVALASKEFRETEGFVRSYQAAVVACCLREIDGKPVYRSLSQRPDPAEAFDKKLDKVKAMYPLTVSMLYQKVVEMEQEYAEMAQKLGKL